MKYLSIWEAGRKLELYAYNYNTSYSTKLRQSEINLLAVLGTNHQEAFYDSYKIRLFQQLQWMMFKNESN